MTKRWWEEYPVFNKDKHWIRHFADEARRNNADMDTHKKIFERMFDIVYRVDNTGDFVFRTLEFRSWECKDGVSEFFIWQGQERVRLEAVLQALCGGECRFEGDHRIFIPHDKFIENCREVDDMLLVLADDAIARIGVNARDNRQRLINAVRDDVFGYNANGLSFFSTQDVSFSEQVKQSQPLTMEVKTYLPHHINRTKKVNEFLSPALMRLGDKQMTIKKARVFNPKYIGEDGRKRTDEITKIWITALFA